MNLWEYRGKNVIIETTDGEIIRGTVDFYTSAEDNEPEDESICFKPRNGIMVEVMKSEIKSITIVK